MIAFACCFYIKVVYMDFDVHALVILLFCVVLLNLKLMITSYIVHDDIKVLLTSFLFCY
jgi:hypothetical protein